MTVFELVTNKYIMLTSSEQKITNADLVMCGFQEVHSSFWSMNLRHAQMTSPTAVKTMTSSFGGYS